VAVVVVRPETSGRGRRPRPAATVVLSQLEQWLWLLSRLNSGCGSCLDWNSGCGSWVSTGTVAVVVVSTEQYSVVGRSLELNSTWLPSDRKQWPVAAVRLEQWLCRCLNWNSGCGCCLDWNKVAVVVVSTGTVLW